MVDCLSYRSSFVSASGSSAFIDEGLHDFSEEYILLNMNLEVECSILSKSANEAVSCEKVCRGGDFMNFRYEGFHVGRVLTSRSALLRRHLMVSSSSDIFNSPESS